MDTIQCAVVLAKLESFEWGIKRRCELGNEYLKLLMGIPGISLPVVRGDRTCVWGQFTVQADDREALMLQLAALQGFRLRISLSGAAS